MNKIVTAEEVAIRLQEIKKAVNMKDTAMMKKAFSFIDLTTLNTTDNSQVVDGMIDKVNHFNKNYPEMPNVAAVCVYPNFVKGVKEKLSDKKVKIACVTGGFPSSQTFLSVKLAETSLAVEKGADETDMVLSVGSFIAGEFEKCAREITLIKTAAGNAHLKVILETGALPTLNDIRIASVLAMESGADFIKTSTGKLDPPSTPEAVYVMADAIKDYYSKTGKKIGLKPAGGIATTDTALFYCQIVKEVLGDEWLSPGLFRLGASRLANNLINDIYKTSSPVKYF